MLSLFKRKTDPEQARVEISDVVERVELVAMPSFWDFDTRIKHSETPLGDGERVFSFPTNTKEDIFREATEQGDYFIPDYAFRTYHLRIGCSATYIADGTLSLPALTDDKFSLNFGKPVHYDQNKSNWWLLRLGQGDSSYNSRFPTEVIKKLLVAQGFAQERDLETVAEMVSENVMLHFFGPKDDVGHLQGKKRVDDLIGKGYELARELYRNELQERFKDGIPEPVLPGRYSFQVVGDDLKPLNP